MIVVLTILLISVFSCKEDTIKVLPIIEFNAPENGYSVIEGESIIIKPTLDHIEKASYKWLEEDKVISTEKILTYQAKTVGINSLILEVTNTDGKTEKEISITVLKRPVPTATFTEENNAVELKKHTEYIVTPTFENSEDATYEWFLGDTSVSSEKTYTFSSDEKGEYLLKVVITTKYGKADATLSIKVLPDADDYFRPADSKSSELVSKVFNITIAPGQYAPQFETKEDAITESEKFLKGESSNINIGYINLGALGGSITVGFDHSIVNKEDEEDFQITTNFYSNPAPSTIWVMQDDNGNGKADDQWYRIKGNCDSDAIADYEITYMEPADREEGGAKVKWTDNKEEKGEINTNQFINNSQYPKWEGESYTIKCFKLKTDYIANAWGGVAPNYEYYKTGYANITGDTKVKIEDAVDNNNQPVSLKHIDFVKIQNSVFANCGMMGESRLPIKNIKDLNLISK